MSSHVLQSSDRTSRNLKVQPVTLGCATLTKQSCRRYFPHWWRVGCTRTTFLDLKLARPMFRGFIMRDRSAIESHHLCRHTALLMRHLPAVRVQYSRTSTTRSDARRYLAACPGGSCHVCGPACSGDPRFTPDRLDFASTRRGGSDRHEQRPSLCTSHLAKAKGE